MNKKAKGATVAVFLLLLFGFCTAFLLLPDKQFSPEENRGLATFHSPTVKSVVSGEYADMINSYYADQFPLRNFLIDCKARMELLFGKEENNGILLGKKGELAKRLYDMQTVEKGTVISADIIDRRQINSAADGILRCAENCKVPMCVLLPDRPIDVKIKAFSYPESGEPVNDILTERLRGDPALHFLNMTDFYRNRFEAGEYVYYKTDHHWTTLGAYYAYTEIMSAFQMKEEIIPPEEFIRETVSDCFFGTFWSSSGMKFVSPDKVEYWLRGNESDFEVIADGKELLGFYNPEYLEKKDKYASFLDGTHDVVTVTSKTEENRPKLLVIKDSFANSLSPFLAQHFDLILLNLSSARTDFTNVSSLAEKYRADGVLLLYSVGNLLTNDKLNRLH